LGALYDRATCVGPKMGLALRSSEESLWKNRGWMPVLLTGNRTEKRKSSARQDEDRVGRLCLARTEQKPSGRRYQNRDRKIWQWWKGKTDWCPQK
jgi:hypothetical protein